MEKRGRTGGLALPHVPASLPVVLAVTALVVVAGWLIFGANAPLHEDEAIYAAWGRTVLTNDLFLQRTPVDKPPLFLYALAGTFASLGVSATIARLPNVLITALIVLLTARLSRRPSVAALLLLVTPITIFFAASAFTDPLMVACGLAGWYAIRRGRPVVAGIACAFALLTKPTALFLAPPILFALWDQREAIDIRSFVLGLGMPLAVVWAWDASRLVPSWWQLGRQAYGSLGTPAWTRLIAWWQPALLGLGGSWLALLALGYRRNRRMLMIAGTIAAWLPLHIVLGLQPWDRYLLPLAPLLAWLAAEGLPMKYVKVLLLGNAVLLLVLLSTPTPGLAGRDGRWAGITEMASMLQQVPDDVDIYHRELGRPLAFYAPGIANRLRWVPPTEQPPANVWWAGRPDDPECAQVVWQTDVLAVCRTS